MSNSSGDVPAASDVPTRTDVVVLGGGPAGLSAAWELTKSGAAVCVLEKSDAPGGLCRTFRRHGFSFDLGGHRFITRDRELFEDVVRALGTRLHVAERSSVVRVGGNEYSYPLRLGEVLRREGVLGISHVLTSWLASRLRSRAREPGRFDEWVTSQFGRALYDRFFAGYTEKLWGIPASELSSDWAAERIPRLSLSNVILRAVGLERRRRRTFARKFCYPRHGIGEIFETVAEEVEQRGGLLFTSARPVALRAGPRPSVVFEASGSRHEIDCQRVISTIPLPQLVRLLGANERLLESAAQLKFRGLRFLNVELEGPAISERTWMYVPDPQLIMTRVQVPAQRSKDNCPAGKSSVQLEIPCDPGNELWEADHADLLERGLGDLGTLGFPVRERVCGSFDVRAEFAYPVYGVGYREHRDLLLSWTDSLEAIDACGRQGRFRYIFFDRAMREGIDAARRFLGKSTQEPQDREPLLPEEAHSLIDELPKGMLSGDAG